MRMIMASMVLLASLSGAAHGQANSDQPKIVVEGYGEVLMPPDLATITYTLRGEGKTSDDAVRAMTRSGDQVGAALLAIDPASEPKTKEMRVSPARDSACKDSEYSREDDLLSNGSCAILGYVATQSVTVQTKAVKDAGTMASAAARNAYNVSVDDFDLTDDRPARRQAIAAGLADAQMKAAAIAAGSHLNLGPIISITTSAQGSRQDIVITGSRIPQPNLVTRPPVNVNMEAEQIKVGASVTVTYAIAR